MYNQSSHIDIDEHDNARCHLCNTGLPSVRSIAEHINGHRHKKAQAALIAAQKNSDSSNNVQPKLVVNSEEKCSQSNMIQSDCLCENVPDTSLHLGCESSIGSVQEEHFSTDKDLNVQAETCTDLKESKPVHEEYKFQNILSLGGNSYLCLVCQFNLVNYVAVEQHIIGKKHAKNLALTAVNIENMWQKVRELECGKHDTIHMTSVNKFKCKLCSKRMEIIGVIPHVESSIHQQRLGEFKTGKINKDKKFSPDTNLSLDCDYQYIWNEIYKAEGGRWCNVSQNSKGIFNCKLCNIKMTSCEILTHVSEESHQEKINSRDNVEKNKFFAKLSAELWHCIPDAERTHEIYFKVDSGSTHFCISCSVIVPSTVQNVIDHIHGKVHMKKVINTRITSEQQTEIRVRNVSTDISPPKPESSQSCDLPNTSPRKNTQHESHISSENAQKALVDALVPKVKDNSGESTNDQEKTTVSFQCFICNFEAASEELWRKHKDSRRHGNRIDRLTGTGKELVLHDCLICDTIVLCLRSDIEKHLCQKNEVPAEKPDKNVAEQESEEVEETTHVPRIIVTGFPKGVGMELLYRFFKDFGPISFVAVTGDSALIDFLCKKPGEK